MAKKIDSFPKAVRNSSSRYPWDEWLDGSVWELEQDTDFTCQLVSMQMGAGAAARTRGLAVHTQINKEEKTLYIQAYHPNPQPAKPKATPVKKARKAAKKKA